MNILLAHFRIGETDGASLEMEKWESALEQLGHQVFYLAGSAGSCANSNADIIPELHYLDPFNDKIIHNAYVECSDFTSESALLNAIKCYAKHISTAIKEVIVNRNIDIIVPNNIFSLGYHLSAGLGLLQAIQETQTRAICHHHDFHWERDKYAQPTCTAIHDLLTSTFPPKNPLIKHCVINRIAQREIKLRCNIDATVVPNVFDFHSNNWKVDPYNQDLRTRFGIDADDVIFLQATRIVARKGIELAIDLITQVEKQRQQLIGKELYNGEIFSNNSRLILLFAGICEEHDYLSLLKDKALKQGVELLIISDWVAHSRTEKEGKKVYALWDVYSHADIITYPSLLEGWGNQFLEGLVAKVPMAVYRYPVYDLDIADNHFNIIDLGNTHQIDTQGLAYIGSEKLSNGANKTIAYLTDKLARNDAMSANYQIGKKHFSYPALKSILQSLFIDRFN